KGRVVNISSLNGIVASPMLGPYSMSKHAIEAYGDGLASELGRLGVRVSLIEPGNYGTEIGKNLLARMDTSVVKGSRFEAQWRSAINTMRGFESNPPPRRGRGRCPRRVHEREPEAALHAGAAGGSGHDRVADAHERSRSAEFDA